MNNLSVLLIAFTLFQYLNAFIHWNAYDNKNNVVDIHEFHGSLVTLSADGNLNVVPSAANQNVHLGSSLQCFASFTDKDKHSALWAINKSDKKLVYYDETKKVWEPTGYEGVKVVVGRNHVALMNESGKVLVGNGSSPAAMKWSVLQNVPDCKAVAMGVDELLVLPKDQTLRQVMLHIPLVGDSKNQVTKVQMLENAKDLSASPVDGTVAVLSDNGDISVIFPEQRLANSWGITGYTKRFPFTKISVINRDKIYGIGQSFGQLNGQGNGYIHEGYDNTSDVLEMPLLSGQSSGNNWALGKGWLTQDKQPESGKATDEKKPEKSEQEKKEQGKSEQEKKAEDQQSEKLKQEEAAKSKEQPKFTKDLKEAPVKEESKVTDEEQKKTDKTDNELKTRKQRQLGNKKELAHNEEEKVPAEFPKKDECIPTDEQDPDVQHILNPAYKPEPRMMLGDRGCNIADLSQEQLQ